MTATEAIENALIIAQQIEVKGKRNLTNLLFIIQILEGLKELKTGGDVIGDNNPETVENKQHVEN